MPRFEARRSKFKGSRFGTNNEIWLKTKRNFSVFLNTLTSNLCVVRVHAFVAREISVLPSENLSLRFPTSSVQSVQAYVEDPQETARPQASASASWNSQSSVARRTHTENSRSTLWSYPPRVESAVSWNSATVHIAISGFALAQRSLGFGLGRTVLSLSRQRLGCVFDGGKAVSSKSSDLPRSCAAQRQREHARVVSRLHNHCALYTQTYPCLGLRRGFRYYQTRHKPRLDRSALPFSSHQPIAELPRPTKSQTPWQTPARGALSTDPPSSRASRWPSAPIRARSAQQSRSASKTTACHAHDRSRVSQADRPFQSLSEIPKIKSANDYRQPRSYEPKSS